MWMSGHFAGGCYLVVCLLQLLPQAAHCEGLVTGCHLQDDQPLLQPGQLLLSTCQGLSSHAAGRQAACAGEAPHVIPYSGRRAGSKCW